MMNYPYTDERGFTWHDEDSYTDEVGGEHDSGCGWNPLGVWCGECCRATCRGCVNESLIPIGDGDIIDTLEYYDK